LRNQRPSLTLLRLKGGVNVGPLPGEAQSISYSMPESRAIRCGIGRQDRLRRHAA